MILLKPGFLFPEELQTQEQRIKPFPIPEASHLEEKLRWPNRRPFSRWIFLLAQFLSKTHRKKVAMKAERPPVWQAGIHHETAGVKS